MRGAGSCHNDVRPYVAVLVVEFIVKAVYDMVSPQPKAVSLLIQRLHTMDVAMQIVLCTLSEADICMRNFNSGINTLYVSLNCDFSFKCFAMMQLAHCVFIIYFFGSVL